MGANVLQKKKTNLKLIVVGRTKAPDLCCNLAKRKEKITHIIFFFFTHILKKKGITKLILNNVVSIISIFIVAKFSEVKKKNETNFLLIFQKRSGVTVAWLPLACFWC